MQNYNNIEVKLDEHSIFTKIKIYALMQTMSVPPAVKAFMVRLKNSISKAYHITIVTILYRLLNDRAYTNKLYNKSYKNLAKREMKSKYPKYSAFFNQLWRLGKSRRFTPPLRKSLTDVSLRVMANNSLHSMCGVQPMKSTVSLLYLLTTETAPKDDKSYHATITINTHPVQSETKLISIIQSDEPMDDALRDALISVNNMYIEEFLKAIKLLAKHYTSSSDAHDIVSTIQKAALDIGTETRRGKANVLWVPKYVGDILQMDILDSHTTKEFDGIECIGTFGNMDVWVYTDDKNSPIIVGYKGVSETDAGFMLSPYLPIVPSTSTQIHTRFVLTHDENRANYYRVIDIE